MRAVVSLLVMLSACANASTSVVEDWVGHAFAGDVAEAGALVEEEAMWFGVGESPAIWIAGAVPFESRDITVTCEGEAAVVCDVTWTDRWIDAITDLDQGGLHIVVRLSGSKIEAFETFEFSPQVRAAFEDHLEWLRVENPSEFNLRCAENPLSEQCSRLLVETAGDWQRD